MRMQTDGTPIIATPLDSAIADGFAEKLADALYNRLPRMVKMFIGKDTFTFLLRGTISAIATRVG